MKRFYKVVSIEPEDKGFSIRLDGKPVKTPARQTLTLPTTALAEAVAEEWRGQGEEIVPSSMPLTQMANAAADLTGEDRTRIADHLAGYASTELLCYREPQEGALRQAQHRDWECWLRWAEDRYEVRFERVEGIMPVAQAQATLQHMRQVIESHQGHRLVTLNLLTGALGSLILALALMEDEITPEEALNLSRLETAFQEKTWGEDATNRALEDSLKAEVEAAIHFLNCVGSA